MATATVTQLITKIVSASSTAASGRAAPQGGIIEGSDPTKYDPKNPIIIFIIQAGIIIIFCRLLHWPLSKLRQPRVIAEVIGGILLGPSVMGRIPGFQDAIFPTASMPNLTLVANLGLVLFLFLVGLEVDLRFLVSNWRIALSVGAAGMALPFGLGCAIAWGLYGAFRHEAGTVPIDFPVYMLFIGVAMAITAFPVLCRILTELKLLSTPVGVIVLSAGVGNDVVGWILLALCVALVNAGTGITALWVLLTCVAFTLFMAFAVRPVFMWTLNRTRSIQDGPSQSVVALTLLIALASAFFTGVIGVHPIFGAFIAGLICPHEGGFAIKVTEKIEDLISALFLPLYFALSGLSTNFGLLNDGKTWGYVFGVVATAFFGKVIGGSGAARLNGLVWRECFTIGALMSCKGLVELIVLNIGLQAKILSVRTFTIFVVMALITTFATTPLVSALYPPWYQQKLEAWKRGEIDWDSGEKLDASSDESSDPDTIAFAKQDAARVKKILMHVRLDNMPGLLALVAMCGGANEGQYNDQRSQETKSYRRSIPPISAHGVRLIQLTERESSVMKVSEVEEYSALDPVINTVRAFGRLHNVAISGEVAIAPETYFADTLVSRARAISSDLLLLPWSAAGSMSESQIVTTEDARKKMTSGPYQDFIKNAMRNASSHVAIFVDHGFGGTVIESRRRLTRTVSGISTRDHDHSSDAVLLPKQSHRIFVPFYGTHDDQVAVRLACQFVHDPRVNVIILHAQLETTGTQETSTTTQQVRGEENKISTSSISHPLHEIDQQTAFLDALRSSLPAGPASRTTCETLDLSDNDLMAANASIARLLCDRADQAGDLILAGRNAESASSSCLGFLVDASIKDGCRASLLVLQSHVN